MSKNIPVILGQTASGKTSVGNALAQQINGEIISIDSRKVYRDLPIGTATPTGTWKEGAYIVNNIPHYLMAHLSPDQYTTAGDFAKDAELLIQKILDKGKTPLLVGGTGFYFKALEHGLPKLPPRNPEIRRKLEEELAEIGGTAMHRQLTAIDPKTASTIAKNDRQKVVRALEVFRISGIPVSRYPPSPKKKSKFNYLVMGLRYPAELIERRIEVRSQNMVDKGMIEETETLLKQGVSKNCPALVSFGFKEAVQVIEKKLPRADFLSFLIKGTKAYAKRQRTWFRTQVQPTWFDCDDHTDANKISSEMKRLLYSS